MIRKLIFLIIFIVMASTAMSLSFDFNETIAGKDKQLNGNLILSPNIYEKSSKIKLTIDGNSAEKTIEELITCTNNCKESSSNFYSYTGATAAEISSTNFLAGISIKRGSSVSIDAKFNISNSDNNYPDTPTIDVGDDGIIEWKFKGKAPASIDWNVNIYNGPNVDQASATELNLDSTGTCQQIFLNKSNSFRINSLLKKSITNPPSLGVYIQGKETTVESCGNLQNAFSQIECTISLQNPVESGDYKICLTSPSPGIVLAVNDTSVNSQGYRCTSSSCNKVSNTDYAIQAKASNFLTTLQESLEYFESNTNQGSYFKDAIASFLQRCIHYNDICVIPINISAKNSNNVKLHGLSYTETLPDGQSYNRNKFLLGVKEEGLRKGYEERSGLSLERSKNKRIGVIGTEGTVKSGAFERELKKLNPKVKVFQNACPLLVPIVESGEKDNIIIDRVLKNYLTPLMKKEIDTLILGCTHYGILSNEIKKILNGVNIINEGEIVAEKLDDYLARHLEIEGTLSRNSKTTFYTTDLTDRFKTLGSRFFGKPVEPEKVNLT
ncbi:MAG: aspartate/glutamate racemase family protein [Parcubacteria group bacterium]|nr:aspartate/glutamate racemase family protein [Parcubacteria group bacterium]